MSKIYSSKIPIHNVRNNRNCPKCGNTMKVITEEKSVAGGRKLSISDMKIYNTKFFCPLCRLKYTEQDLIRIEKLNKNK